MLINLEKKDDIILKNAKRCKEKNIVLPTFREMKDPNLIKPWVRERLKNVGLWDVDPINLYRINWHNEAKEKGGLYKGVNFIEIPRSITGVKARIIAHFQHGALLYFDSIKVAAYISTARRGLLPMQVVASSTVLESLSTAELESELTMPLSSNRGLRIFQLADGMKNLWLDQSVLEQYTFLQIMSGVSGGA